MTVKEGIILAAILLFGKDNTIICHMAMVNCN